MAFTTTFLSYDKAATHTKIMLRRSGYSKHNAMAMACDRIVGRTWDDDTGHMTRIHQDNDNVLLMSHDLVSELNPDTMMTYLIDMTGND